MDAVCGFRHQPSGGLRARARHLTRVGAAALALAAATAAALAAPAFAAPTVVALWNMNELSGTTMHDSVRSHNGALHSVQLGQPGFELFAYGFTGSSYVSVPSASDLNPGSANITFSIYLKATKVPATPDWDIFRKGLYTTSGGEYKMEYQPSGQASCGFKGSSRYGEIIAGPKLNNGVWHKVQCVKTSSSIKLVVDGQTYTKSVSIGSISNKAPVVIGARPGSEYFRGQLDQASIQIG